MRGGKHMPKSETKMYVSLVVIALVLITIILGLMQLLVRNYEILEKGQLLPYSKGTITKVQFFHRWTLYTEFEHLPNADILSAFLFCASGWTALIFSALGKFWGQKGKGHITSFFFWLGVLLTWLAADEFFGLHETIGHNMQWLKALPGIKAPDDAIILFYGLCAAIGLFIFRRIVLADRLAFILWGIAAGIGLSTGVADALRGAAGRLANYYEEFAEVAVAALILFGILRLGLALLRDSIQPVPQLKSGASGAFHVAPDNRGQPPPLPKK